VTPHASIARRTSGALFLLLVLAALAAAMPAPVIADAPQRYVEPVFTSVLESRNLPYGQAYDEHGELQTLYLDLFEPEGDTDPERPAIVLLHGGGFVSGNRTRVESWARYYALRGYVTATIDYRLREDATFSGPTDPLFRRALRQARYDAQAAVRWMRRYHRVNRVDRRKIAMMGTSAGAITALHVAYNSSDRGTSGNRGYRSDVQAVVSYAGATVRHDFMDDGDAPVLMLHGTDDPIVPHKAAVRTCDAALASGLSCDMHAYESAGHGIFFNDEYKPDLRERTSDYLIRTLDLPTDSMTEPGRVADQAEKPGTPDHAAQIPLPNGNRSGRRGKRR
jgi:acetyl esterase/lipase